VIEEEIPMTCLGKELFLAEDVPLGMPIDVLVIARTLDTDGEIAYRILCNPELDTVHAMGMTRFMQMMLEGPFHSVFNNREKEEDEDASGD
jgi:hypothetical protein